MEKKETDTENKELIFFKHLSSFALKLEKASDEHEIFQDIADKIKERYPASYIIISVITPQDNSYNIHILKGIGKLRQAIETLIGKDIFSIKFPLSQISTDNLRLNSNGQLNKIDGGIYTLALESIPKSIAGSIEKMLGINQVYTMGLALDSCNFGNLTIFCKKECVFSTTDITFIETLSVISSIALQKIRIHQRVHLEREKMDRILQVVPVGIGLLIDRIFQDVNDRVCEITGYS
ncbi:MAG: GAF domain-containing protein, partial [Bacteroidales bacterium]|nr:GAF domain-containing protein [Bacteroidales bacterium]